MWVDGAGESHIAEGKSGDAVGAVRNVLYDGRHIRQRLLALSDVERLQAYEFCEGAPGRDNRASLRITPVIDGDRAFVEWWATFDCEADHRDEWTAFFRSAATPQRNPN